MRKSILLLVLNFALLLNSGFAGEPTKDLSPKDAVRLVSLKAEVPEKTIEISFIIDGTAKCGDGFEAKHVRRVAAIHAGDRNRQLFFYDLFWNESLGWFMWESRQERTGETVYLWSELRGKIANR